MWLLSSLGLKRRVAGAIVAILEVLRIVPGSETLIAPLEGLAGLFGVAGLGHAGVAKTISKDKIASVGALLALLSSLAMWVPVLMPYAVVLQKAAALIGAVAAGQKLQAKK